MYARQPLSDLELLTCRKCGTPQESPGSTVCEQCGADLVRPRIKRASLPRPALRLKQFLRVPVQLVRRGIAGLLLLVSLVFRGVTLLLLLASLVIGLSFVPEVNARVPATKEIAATAKKWFQRAEDWGGKLLASWEVETQPQRRTFPPAASPQKPSPAQFAATQAVMISSSPGGATVRLGTRPVGKTPVTLRVAPGTYKVTISRPGYATVTRTITVKQGKPASLGVTLVAAGPSPAQPASVLEQTPDTKDHKLHTHDGDEP